MPDYRYLHGANGDDHYHLVEMDPTGRYGRYNEVLGKGAFKTVYKAFDERNGIEVAWNQINIQDVLRTPEDLQRIYSEVHLLKTLKHKNIIKFYTSWVDSKTQKINFITEMFTSGTLREYRQKHRRVDIKAIKNWACQILQGLCYLHSHDPPIIHRDLKCDNIFVNGNQGEVKIGDLGLAAILRQSHAAHSVIGTPEFMAPELYEEHYNELVDIYAFGMCLLEMLTLEYPYSECSNPAQIYKKVTSGKKPDALYRIEDPEVRQFVEKCLATASERLPAKDLLMDHFLEIADEDSEKQLLRMCGLNGYVLKDITSGERMGLIEHTDLEMVDPSCGDFVLDEIGENNWEPHRIALSPNLSEKNSSKSRDFTIKGKRREDDTIFLRVRIADKEGHVRNIHFPFDVESDSAMGVASEMVAELDITDHDEVKIADMIEEEISALVPNWKGDEALGDCEGGEEGLFHDHFVSNPMGHGFRCSTTSSESSLLNYLTSHKLVDCQSGPVPSTRIADAVHGRFEEVTYQVNPSDLSFYVEYETPTISTESSDIHQDADYWSIGEDQSYPSSPLSNRSEARNIFPCDEHQLYYIASGTDNRKQSTRFCKPAELTKKARLSDDQYESWEQVCPDGSCYEYHGFQSNGLSEGFIVSPHYEQDSLRPACQSQFLQSTTPLNCLSDDDENVMSRELSLLAAKHEQDFKELKRKHHLSQSEIIIRLSKEKTLRCSPNGLITSPRPIVAYPSEKTKMGMDSQQELNDNHMNRHSRQLKQGLKEEMISIKQGTAAAPSNRLPGNHSSKSFKDSTISLDKLPISSQATTPSASHVPTNQKALGKRRMTKMNSLGDIHGFRYMNSLAAEISRLRLYQTVGVVSTEKIKCNQDFPKSMKIAPAVPRTSSLKGNSGKKPL